MNSTKCSEEENRAAQIVSHTENTSSYTISETTALNHQQAHSPNITQKHYGKRIKYSFFQIYEFMTLKYLMLSITDQLMFILAF